MKVLIFLNLCCWVIPQTLCAANISESSEYRELLYEIKNHGPSYFEKKWQDSDADQKQTLIKKQREIFRDLFSKFKKSQNSSIDTWELLAKTSRITPIFAPYQIQLLDFINSQKVQVKKQYFSVLSNYIPAISSAEISYQISEEHGSHIVYNADTLKCVFTAGLIKIQLSCEQRKSLIGTWEAVNGLVAYIKSLNIIIDDIKVFLDDKSLDLVINMKKPSAQIVLQNDNILITINPIDKKP